MKIPTWLHSWKVLLLSSILFPPIGLFLLWTNPSTRLSRKILNSLYIAGLAVLYLVWFFGLRMELNGSGISPIFSFYKPKSHSELLERNRAKQRETAPSNPEVAMDVKPATSMRQPRTEELTRGKAPTSGPAVAPSKVSSPSRAYWTDFRGPRRDGLYDEQEVLDVWPSGRLPLLWKQPIGGGYASFVVAGGSAFTIEQRRQQEVLASYDLETGRELWIHSWNAEFREGMGGDGPRATPTWEGGRIYALGAVGDLHCLVASSGKLIWSQNILNDNQAQNLQWGMSAAPLVVEDKVIVLPGGPSGKSVVAYNKLTGQTIWKSLDDKQAYTSPMLVTLCGQRQLLIVSAQRAIGLAVEDGRLLWEFPWVTDHGINSAQPLIIADNRFFISAGYGHGAAMVEVSNTGKGFVPRIVWQNVAMKNKFNSSVFYQGYIYGLDESILACVDAENGERKWKGGRYGYGQLLLAGGNLIILTESGELALVKASPEKFLELARFSAIEGKTWNHPALASGWLLVRNTTEMACFKISR